eukprot:3574306-Pyramimonas_sp.AAC.1
MHHSSCIWSGDVAAQSCNGFSVSTMCCSKLMCGSRPFQSPLVRVLLSLSLLAFCFTIVMRPAFLLHGRALCRYAYVSQSNGRACPAGNLALWRPLCLSAVLRVGARLLYCIVLRHHNRFSDEWNLYAANTQKQRGR